MGLEVKNLAYAGQADLACHRRITYSIYCIGVSKKLCHHPVRAMTSNLEDRIRELCSQAIQANDAQELNRILGELKLALHEHTERLRAMLSLYPILPADLVKPDL